MTERSHSVWMGYLLWIFGFFGAHRFYYGRRVSGTIYLFTLGLLFVGWIVDLVLIPAMARGASRSYREGEHSYEVAWVLQTFLGPLGLHRMYLGKWLSGLLWFFTGGLLGVGYIYDYLTLNEQVSLANEKR